MYGHLKVLQIPTSLPRDSPKRVTLEEVIPLGSQEDELEIPQEPETSKVEELLTIEQEMEVLKVKEQLSDPLPPDETEEEEEVFQNSQEPETLVAEESLSINQSIEEV
ncbi:hypothetical protein AMTR_s00144p00100610 [Amborella trichopoda]|uniref:Uncharacterized protein n=1 Tax=Amborella trichopoda TaxID=13333 RepID=W1P9P9_AMBTC|nr:hypothetical protein AMTR_s00144p00100610 [Amborella trichopoda]